MTHDPQDAAFKPENLGLTESFLTTEARVLAALKKLGPFDEERASGITMRVRDDTHYLMSNRPNRSAHFPELQVYQNRHELVGDATSRREIATVRKGAQKLLSAINQLHAPARQALGIDPSRQRVFEQIKVGKLQFPIETTLQLLIINTEFFDLPALPKNAGRGRKRMTQETKFALAAGHVYARAAGKLPTLITDTNSQSWKLGSRSAKELPRPNDTHESGAPAARFLSFLTEMFSIFDVEGSPIVHARTAIAEMTRVANEAKKAQQANRAAMTVMTEMDSKPSE